MALPPQIEQLRQTLRRPLPGWARQRRMAPENRPTDIDRMSLVRDDHRESSVLLLLYPDQAARLHFVLIRRPEYEGVHSGQIAFPGGAREADETPQTTALREADEEIGVPAEMVTVLGSLTSLYIPPSNFMVYPFVGYCRCRPAYRPNQREVAEILEPPLAMLVDETIVCHEYRHLSQIGRAKIPYYDVFGHKVWGATAMMLAEFSALVENLTLIEPNGHLRNEN